MLPMVHPDNVVLGGWDISGMHLGDAMRRAQVLDVDLGAPMSDAVFGQVHRAFLDSGGLFAAAGRISTGISSVPSRFVRIATKSCSLTSSCTWMSLER